jgi:hypothetical protein
MPNFSHFVSSQAIHILEQAIQVEVLFKPLHHRARNAPALFVCGLCYVLHAFCVSCSGVSKNAAYRGKTSLGW